MPRAFNSFSVLQATAAIVALAILFWSLGLPSLRFAEAANVTSFSDTVSTSEPSVAANHTISFVTPSGLVAGETITLTFESGFTGIGSLVAADLDMFVEGVGEESLIDGAASGADWNVTAAGQVIDIQSGTDTIGAGATVTIEIGTHAWETASGTNQITNPGVAGPYKVNVDVGDTPTDTGETIIAIIDTVTVSAQVDTLFTFTVNAVPGGTLVNTADTTGGPTTATTIPFGELVADTASTAAQNLEVETNAANGFVVTAQVNQQLTSANGADIDGFENGNYSSTPIDWEANAPGGTVGNEWEYGHWGMSSNDTTLTAGLSDLYSGGDNFVSASTTPVEVFRNDGPTDGTGAGTGNADVIFKVEITALQEAADDYTATLTYVATPVF